MDIGSFGACFGGILFWRSIAFGYWIGRGGGNDMHERDDRSVSLETLASCTYFKKWTLFYPFTVAAIQVVFLSDILLSRPIISQYFWPTETFDEVQIILSQNSIK